MNFIALDVETANADFASICQIGLVEFIDGKLTKQWQWYVNPEDRFDPSNTFIHGIDAKIVSGAKNFPALYPMLRELLDGKIIVHHMPFDMVSLSRAAEKHGLPQFECQWLDSARVARRAWEQYRQRGYALANLAEEFNIQFQHHRADEDARVAGEIMLKAIEETGISLDEWLIKAYTQKRDRRFEPKIAQEGNPDGPLYGEIIAFTGSLSIPRPKAASLAAEMGCNVGDGVTKKTTLLVVGDQDLSLLAGKTKSNKHLKAEKLISEGQSIRIISESDFNRLVGISNSSSKPQAHILEQPKRVVFSEAKINVSEKDTAHLSTKKATKKSLNGKLIAWLVIAVLFVCVCVSCYAMGN